MKSDNKINVLIAAGGTGGHLFPAIAIADELKSILPTVELLFIGTKKRMESEIIPKLGYKFVGTSIKGFPRKIGLNTIIFIISFKIAFLQALKEVFKFKPKVAIGTGSYISVPPLLASKMFGAKIFLSETNSLPGIATKFLAPFATEIYITFEQSKKYFKDQSKLILTGTPIRKTLFEKNREEALKYFNLSDQFKTILVIGGSLGAKSINEKMKEIYKKLSEKYQIIWQTGKNDFIYYKDLEHNERVIILPFIERMDYAYSVCDLLISRSGALTISEIIAQGIPSILIPSPNVTENHQFYNAMELVNNKAAEIHFDNDSVDDLLKKIIILLNDEQKLKDFSKNAHDLFKSDASKIISLRIKKYLEESD